MRARGIIPLVKLVGQKYRDKTILASKTRFSRHCFGFNSPRFPPRVGYNIWPSSSSTNQEAALIIDHQLDRCYYIDKDLITTVGKAYVFPLLPNSIMDSLRGHLGKFR